MEIDIAHQAFTFLGAILLGLGIGFLYDLFRILRHQIGLRLIGSLLDFIFWVITTITLFVYAIAMGGGEVRFYMIVGLFLGAMAYFFVFSPLILVLAECIGGFFSSLWWLATRPYAICCGALKKFKKILKNIFHYYRKWYNIEEIVQEMESLYPKDSNQISNKRGNRIYATFSKNRAYHKNGRIRTPELYDDYHAQRSKSNSSPSSGRG